MNPDPSPDKAETPEVVSNVEINSWRRGFTPQAEIWNGRMAMFGLAVGLSSLLIVHFLFGR